MQNANHTNYLSLWNEDNIIKKTFVQQGVRQLFPVGKSGDESCKKFAVVLGNMLASPKNDFLKKSASPETVIQVAAEAARLDIMVDGKESVVASFKGKAALIVMPAGLLKIAYRNPEILRIHTDVIRSNDEFSYNPVEGELIHEVNWMMPDEERGDIVLAYALADIERNGRKLRMIQVVNKSAIEKAKNSSPSAEKPGSPWQNHYGEMAKKTALRKLCKVLPMEVASEDDTGFAEWQVAERAEQSTVKPETTAPHNVIDSEAVDPQHRPEPFQQQQPQVIQQQQPAQQPVQQPTLQSAQQSQLDSEWAPYENQSIDPSAL